MLISVSGGTDGGEGDAGPPSKRWRYVGPPGDGRRSDADAVASGAVAADEGDNVTVDRARRRGWQHETLGTQMQSKDAGLNGLASPVEAAGGEKPG
jgi:hypothetical protein